MESCASLHGHRTVRGYLHWNHSQVSAELLPKSWSRSMYITVVQSALIFSEILTASVTTVTMWRYRDSPCTILVLRILNGHAELRSFSWGSHPSPVSYLRTPFSADLLISRPRHPPPPISQQLMPDTSAPPQSPTISSGKHTALPI